EKRPWREVLHAFEQAGRGLAAAHAAGLVHRDFKPENVLVDEARHRVCVTDFGLVRMQATHETSRRGGRARQDAPATMTRTGAVMGTPAYMAPEQYRSEAVDSRTDQFAFAVSLYEALYGDAPFEGDTIEARAAAVLMNRRRPVPRKTDVPRAIH